MNIMNHYGCGADGARANEHSLVGHVLRETIRQPYRTEGMMKGLHVRRAVSPMVLGAHPSWDDQIERECREGMVSHENDNKMFSFDVISSIQIWQNRKSKIIK